MDRTALTLAILAGLPVPQTETAKRVLAAVYATADEIQEIDLTPGQYREHLRILAARRMRDDGLSAAEMSEIFNRVVNTICREHGTGQRLESDDYHANQSWR